MGQMEGVDENQVIDIAFLTITWMLPHPHSLYLWASLTHMNTYVKLPYNHLQPLEYKLCKTWTLYFLPKQIIHHELF